MGAEVGLQTARQWMTRNQDATNKVFVKLDFRNAFNTIDRATFLREVRDHFPGMAPWVDFCYSTPSKLLFGATEISSEMGVQQGDPLGPLLFSLTLQPLLRELASHRAANKLELVFAYLDDLCLAGNAEEVAEAVNFLRTRAAAIGLQLSTGTPDDKDKCEVILVAGANSSVDCRLFPNDFKVIGDQNFVLLGSPIGSPEFCEAHTRERVAKAQKLLTALGELPDPQVALKLLQTCGSFCKMVFSCRTIILPSTKTR